MNVTLNPIKLIHSAIQMYIEAFRFTAHIILDFFLGKANKAKSLFGRWDEFCEKFGLPKTPMQAIFQTFFLTKIGIALVEEIFLLFKQNFFGEKRKDLAGELALVVGSNRPLGGHIARKLAKAKAKVICLGSVKEEDEVVSKEINSTGGEAHYYRCKVGNQEDVLRVLNLINKEVGDITMFFNCYLFPDKGTYNETSRDIIDRCIVGNFNLLENLIPVMKSNGKGHIVFLKSVSSMMKAKDNCLPVIVSQYGVEGMYNSSMEKLQQLQADKQVKTSMIRVYPEVVDVASGEKLKEDDFFGKIDTKLTAEMIVSGIQNGCSEFATPYSAVFVESIVGMLPLKVAFRIRKMLYHA